MRQFDKLGVVIGARLPACLTHLWVYAHELGEVAVVVDQLAGLIVDHIRGHQVQKR